MEGRSFRCSARCRARSGTGARAWRWRWDERLRHRNRGGTAPCTATNRLLLPGASAMRGHLLARAPASSSARRSSRPINGSWLGRFLRLSLLDGSTFVFLAAADAEEQPAIMAWLVDHRIPFMTRHGYRRNRRSTLRTRPGHYPLSASCLQHLRTTLRAALNLAVREGVPAINPMRGSGVAVGVVAHRPARPAPRLGVWAALVRCGPGPRRALHHPQTHHRWPPGHRRRPTTQAGIRAVALDKTPSRSCAPTAPASAHGQRPLAAGSPGRGAAAGCGYGGSGQGSYCCRSSGGENS